MGVPVGNFSSGLLFRCVPFMYALAAIHNVDFFAVPNFSTFSHSPSCSHDSHNPFGPMVSCRPGGSFSLDRVADTYEVCWSEYCVVF